MRLIYFIWIKKPGMSLQCLEPIWKDFMPAAYFYLQILLEEKQKDISEEKRTEQNDLKILFDEPFHSIGKHIIKKEKKLNANTGFAYGFSYLGNWMPIEKIGGRHFIIMPII